jgi:asparagine synthase (glutamine-hydrolysing)
MCGIAGVLDQSGQPVSPVILRRMTDAIKHRGPDGEGHFVDGSFGLGHRRLAVIDLSAAGHQPMSTEDGRFIIAYNGEIYNFNEIRIELESAGYCFYSRTDSEVVLKALAHWGASALSRFNGMFALALWDRKNKELLLARDRYGIKPLYYVLNGSRFLFGSEIKAILADPSYKTELDHQGLLEYLTFQNYFTEHTLFKGVYLLEQGSYLRVSLSKGPSRPVKYWDYSFEEPHRPSSDEDYLEELNRLFCQAVSRQLVSDVDIGSYLSGGIDSGSVTAIAAKQLPYIKSFTCGFDLNSASGVELGYDEREAAEYMSYLLKTEHYEMVLKAGDMERVMNKLAWHIEEPRVGQSYPNFYAAQLASKFVKVVLSGAGGDELFAGYPWRYYRAVVNDSFDHYVDKYYSFWQRLMPNKAIKDVCRPIQSKVDGILTRDIFRDVFLNREASLAKPEDYINHSLYFEAKTFLHGLLVVEDKLSSAHSLETRVPFLDNDLVDFAMKIPARLKLGNLSEVVRLNENDPGPKTAKYFQQTQDGKLLFRKAMKKYIPEIVTDRVKQGFSGPDASWFKGESMEYVRRVLYDNNASIYDFLDRDTVHNLASEHLDGKQNRRLLIWSLLSLENWCQSFLVS